MLECFPFRGLTCAVFVVCLSACAEQGGSDGPTLVGIATLPADTFVDGPTSGQFIGPDNGRTPPFLGKQSVQGFSALLAQDDGSFLALTDNGFGERENSADFVLSVYRIMPDFHTESTGTGTIEAQLAFQLRDPDDFVEWPIVADMAFYPGSTVEVDTAIAAHRLLTGADFDVESFRRVPDGTFYFGDEFGPFLIHTDSAGILLEAPFSLPGVWSPQHPQLGGREPNLPRSAGFEGMALSSDGKTLYPMLEKPLVGDDEVVNIYRFDLGTQTYDHSDPHQPAFRYRLSRDAHYATEFVSSGSRDYLIIERGAGQGPTATLKKVFRVHLEATDEAGLLRKNQVLDLLDIADPNNLGRAGTGVFIFPYETTEALAVIGSQTVAIINDNNYPFGKGRYWAEGEPDPNEFILVNLNEASRSGRSK
jgi:hypothetical protein